jgi:hypothetical protein
MPISEAEAGLLGILRKLFHGIKRNTFQTPAEPSQFLQESAW